ncbi:MAG: class I SAM-dependent methyltransferase [Actinobacteria bacterium]|nr:class I SAM-dependent methyltransferase [Actinomycetota bacterium]
MGLVDVLRTRGARNVLDLGTGIGRHAIALAIDGFEVTAVDASQAGIGEAAKAAAKVGIRPRFAVCSFLDLPFKAESFDYVLAWNVVYHGDGDSVRRAIGEISRVLVSGGLYQGTMLSRRHADLAVAEEISAGTFVQPGTGERSHPHFYCDARELLHLHPGFEPLHLSDSDHRGSGRTGQWHWEFVLEKSLPPFGETVKK